MIPVIATAINDRRDVAFYDRDAHLWVTLHRDHDRWEFRPSIDNKPEAFVSGFKETEPDTWQRDVRHAADERGVVLGTFYEEKPVEDSAWQKDGWWFEVERLKDGDYSPNYATHTRL